MLCPGCQSKLTKKPTPYGDNAVYECKGCGTYQLAGDAINNLAMNKIAVSNLAAFRQMTRERRIGTDSFLIITSDDIRGLPN
jgi:hypothetical protein